MCLKCVFEGMGQEIMTQGIYLDGDAYVIELISLMLDDDSDGTPNVISISYGASEQV